ncbi:MAG: cytochrome d ubiquinol oxidase subunit II [Methylomonas sp.]|nr:cytochrome d ubiquinol oxidase subunit II [Methylomonas sp.]PPD22958.1 MAG: cytochrome d ubiquinol oxidase subunit II [Methylomonas sp.]PPD24527.1 MAG: cytochrome d ubiquinol oxidase subunit II [Methylomonas sp.]PPD33092.1 MAG: cytochrome d ubiquinol oxidase subunit II [Methylomonas sp.]PPD41865.1 MAG: cytochrome d ubiquinol oxidase subunit II [Methylomonas sp.]
MTTDLETLRLLAWAILMLATVGVGLLEGISSGGLALLSAVGERRDHGHALIRTLAPVALLHAAWLMLFLALIFAAWPIAYAVALHSFRCVLLAMLLLLMLRLPLLYFYRQLPEHWQGHACKLLAASGLMMAVGFGLLAGNVLKGVPFHLDSDMRVAFLGDLMTLLNPFAVLVAATVLALLTMHGASYLALHTYGGVQLQLRALQWRAGIGFAILLVLTGLWISHLEGYHVTSDILTKAASNPLAKFVKRSEGLWLDNYEHEPWLAVLPTLAFIACGLVVWLARRGQNYWAMLSSTVCVTMTSLTFGASLFPFLLPSNISLNSSLTIWDSSASPIALAVTVCAAGVGLPLLAILSRWGHTGFAASNWHDGELDTPPQHPPISSSTKE